MLRAGLVPANTPGIFLYGTDALQLPFGDGYRCVGGEVYRLPASTAINGMLSHPMNFGSLPPNGQIFPGSTWNFQAWYRDPAAGGSGFNLSNGFAMTFVP